jgi:glucose-1-phosphate adenylyltransferase
VVPAGCTVIDSIILPNVTLGVGSRIERTIIDKNVVVGGGAQVGHSRGGAVNAQIPNLLNSGLTLIGMHTTIPANVQVGTNVMIAARVAANTWRKAMFADGETLVGA